MRTEEGLSLVHRLGLHFSLEGAGSNASVTELEQHICVLPLPSLPPEWPYKYSYVIKY